MFSNFYLCVHFERKLEQYITISHLQWKLKLCFLKSSDDFKEKEDRYTTVSVSKTSSVTL